MEVPAMVRCPWCSTPQSKSESFLGHLGRLIHFRCRYCGGQFSKGAR
jgi:hypothetical protein